MSLEEMQKQQITAKRMLRVIAGNRYCRTELQEGEEPDGSVEYKCCVYVRGFAYHTADNWMEALTGIMNEIKMKESCDVLESFADAK